MAENLKGNDKVFGKRIDKFFIGLERAFLFLKKFFIEVWIPPYEFKEGEPKCLN